MGQQRFHDIKDNCTIRLFCGEICYVVIGDIVVNLSESRIL